MLVELADRRARDLIMRPSMRAISRRDIQGRELVFLNSHFLGFTWQESRTLYRM